jgi:geranylgeranyl diphosphate synthase type II
MTPIRFPDSDLLSSLRGEVDSRLRMLLCRSDNRTPAALVEAMRHATLAGGKRLRALLLLGIVEALRGDRHNGLSAAAAVEMIHAASLIVDDLPCMDNASNRRGRVVLHRQIGEAATILTAFALINLAFEVLTTMRDVPASTIVRLQGELAGAVGRTGLVAGQWDDLDLSQTRVAHTSIALSKTGVLFAFAARCGGVLCGAGLEDTRRLARFGRLFGLGYQMLDDVCDGESRHGQLVAVRGVLDNARASARGTAWQGVADAFVRPAEEFSRAHEQQEDRNGKPGKATGRRSTDHIKGTSGGNRIEPAALTGIDVLP